MKQASQRKPSGKPSGVTHDSLGHAALRDLTDSASEVARRVGVSRQVVHGWIHGSGRPGLPSRKALEAVYGIAVDAWVMAPDAGDLDALELDSTGDDAAEDVLGSGSPLARTLALLDVQIQHLGRIQESADGLAHPEQVRLSETLGRLLAQRGRLEKDKRVIDAAIEKAVINPARQPFYQRTVNTIVDALKPYPDAMRDVLEALEAVVKESRS